MSLPWSVVRSKRTSHPSGDLLAWSSTTPGDGAVSARDISPSGSPILRWTPSPAGFICENTIATLGSGFSRVRPPIGSPGVAHAPAAPSEADEHEERTGSDDGDASTTVRIPHEPTTPTVAPSGDCPPGLSGRQWVGVSDPTSPPLRIVHPAASGRQWAAGAPVPRHPLPVPRHARRVTVRGAGRRAGRLTVIAPPLVCGASAPDSRASRTRTEGPSL